MGVGTGGRIRLNSEAKQFQSRFVFTFSESPKDKEPQRKAAKDNDDRNQDADANEPMIDMSQTAVKKMIGDARERGYITYDQLNTVLPPDQVSSDQIEDVMSML